MKAILVMEMPENCISCPLDNHGRCYIKPTVGITVIPQKGRPELCPLVPMAERRTFNGEAAIKSPYLSGRVTEAMKEAIALGWNACLDAIEGSKG